MALIITVYILVVISNSVVLCINTCAPCKCEDNKHVNCKIKAINTVVKHVPRNITDNIESIDFQGQPVNNISGYFFSTNSTASLQKVTFRSCNISVIHMDTFLKLANLTYLDLSGNKITTLHIHTFKESKQLMILYLTKNNIRKIENGLFQNLESLMKLDIGYNKLERIERHAFVHNEALQYLDLRGNNLTELDGNIIKELVSLKTFYHHGNPWICDCSLNRLREIVLNRNITYEVYFLQPKCKAPYRLLEKKLYELDATDFTCGLSIITNGQNTVSSIQDDNISLPCLVNGNLDSDIKWKREDLTVDPVKRNRKYDLAKVQINQTMLWYNLTILHISQQDEGMYMCWKNSSAGEEEASISLKVQLVEAPNITILPSNHILVDDDTVNFTVSCKIHSVPKSEVTWIHNNTVINPTQLDKNKVKIINTSEDDFTTWSNLTIIRVNYQQTGRYRCVANNSRSVDEEYITVTLNPSRPPNVTIISDSYNTLASENITLSCRVSAVPRPDVKWMFRFLAINPEKGSDKYLLNNSKMSDGIYWYNITIINITKQDDGEYKCNAENDYGKDNSSFNVKVLSLQKPSIVESDFKNEITNEQLNIMLACAVQAHPNPNVHWTYNGIPFNIYAKINRKYSVKKTQQSEDTYWSYLNITNATMQDIGEYECIADNFEGTDNKKFSIVPDNNLKTTGLVTCVTVAEDVYKCSNATQNTRSNVIMKHVHKPTITNLFDFLKVFKNEYDSSVFKCVVKSFPPPDIYWILNKNTKINAFTPNNSKFSVYMDMQDDDTYQLELYINNVTLENEGEYLCTANNSLGTVENILYLKVKKIDNIIALTKIEITCLVVACVVLTALLCFFYTKCKQRNAHVRFRRITYIHNRFSQCFETKRRRNQRISQNALEQEPLRNLRNIARQAQLDQCSGYLTPKIQNIYENPK